MHPYERNRKQFLLARVQGLQWKPHFVSFPLFDPIFSEPNRKTSKITQKKKYFIA